MESYRYLIVGGGMTADAAVRGIRQVDEQGSIGLISAEADPPYNRPPLSKSLWKGKPLERIWRKTEKLGVTLHLQRRVEALDLDGQTVTDGQGGRYAFEKLLLATGGRPRQFGFATDAPIYYRTLADYQRTRTLAERGQRLAVVGGGFIGTELAAALALNGKKVLMVFPEVALGARLFPPELAQFVSEYYRQKGVELWPEDAVTAIEPAGEQWTLKTRQGRETQVDGIVAGLGLEPNVELALAAGLEVDNGVCVDQHLRTSHAQVYAAGDVANYYCTALGKRVRVEHEDNANNMGQVVGHIMAGKEETYDYLPFFFSDMFELGYEAIGELNPQYDLVADWLEPYHKGVVYYLQGGRVRGVLLWSVWNQVDAARDLVAQPGPFAPSDLVGRILGKGQ